MMNITPAAYPLPPHQQSPYGFAPSPVQRGGSAFQSHPTQQHQQQPHVPPQAYQQPTNITSQGFPSQPLVRPPHANVYGHPSTPIGNGPMAMVSQPGLQQHVEVPQHAYTASPYSQSMPTSSGPISMPQPAPSPAFPTTTAPQQPTSMATSATPLSSSASAGHQQRLMGQSGVPQAQNLPQQAQQQAFGHPIHAQSQAQNISANGVPNAPLSPESIAREKLRVSVLLEINAHLLQDVISLQSQGKAGFTSAGQPQQSPTQDSPPNSATGEHHPGSNNNSPVDPSKPPKPASIEYMEDMKRLQANLAYLAAVADRNKRNTMPNGPQIMAPPQHLKSIYDLYKKLIALFPGVAPGQISTKAPAGLMNTNVKPPSQQLAS